MFKAYKNKAGYTAYTSRGRVGRGGKCVFSHFRSLLITDGQMDQWMDGRTEKASYRVASPQLKTRLES